MVTRWLQLADSIIGLVVIHTIVDIPFCPWLLRPFFITVSSVLESYPETVQVSGRPGAATRSPSPRERSTGGCAVRQRRAPFNDGRGAT